MSVFSLFLHIFLPNNLDENVWQEAALLKEVVEYVGLKYVDFEYRLKIMLKLSALRLLPDSGL